MTPTPGQIVHYQPTPSQLAYAAPDASGVIPAMVTGVGLTGAVNLYLFPNCGAGAMWVGKITEGQGPGRWREPPAAAPVDVEIVHPAAAHAAAHAAEKTKSRKAVTEPPEPADDDGDAS